MEKETGNKSQRKFKTIRTRKMTETDNLNSVIQTSPTSTHSTQKDCQKCYQLAVLFDIQ